jgi:hypothetical protein
MFLVESVLRSLSDIFGSFSDWIYIIVWVHTVLCVGLYGQSDEGELQCCV